MIYCEQTDIPSGKNPNPIELFMNQPSLVLTAISHNGGFPIFSFSEPSEIFLKAAIDNRTPVCDCELCGRTHFHVLGENMDEGELEMYQQHAKENPFKYVERDDQVSCGKIDGRHFVDGCPCNGLAVYEDFVNENLYIIVEYAKAAAQDELEQAQIRLKQAEELDEAAKKL